MTEDTLSGQKKSKLPLILGIGCGGPVAVAIISFIGLLVYFSGQPEGGVLLANQMEEYALDYIDDNNLLNPDEQLVAYYDVTLSMDSSEAAILTDERVIYHNNGQTDAVNLADIDRVEHSEEGLIGDVIDIYSVNGNTLRIEIAPLNGGELFLDQLAFQRQSL
ncbi:MAG: hypothetical protein AAFU71_00015 [Cyanobacteria bacterium J06632_22]